MSELAIQTRHISKSYRIGAHPLRRSLRETISNWAGAPQRLLRRAPREAFWALRDVSLDVRAGEVLALIGRNGAGKTTLMKILARITRPTSGEAVVTGRVGSLLEVGTGFHPELTGRENTFLSGAILGMKKNEIERKFEQIVDFAEIEEFIDTPVKHYSSGMFVRLAFSVAAHLEPEILLVDEVLAVGDASFQKKCLGRMGEVSRHGRTVLFISHNMSAVLNLCTRAVLLEKGSIVVDGPAPEVAKDYLTRLQENRSDDLSTFPERRGNGAVRFTRARFEDRDGRLLTQVMSGQTLVMKASYQASLPRPLSNCRVSVSVHDTFGQALFICSTEMFSRERIDLPPSGTVQCVIPRIPLTQGRYFVSLFMEVNKEIEDWLDSAVSFDVVDGDFFGTGKQCPDGWEGKGVMLEHSWEFGTDSE